MSAVTGLTTKKKITKAIVTKAASTFRKWPQRNTDLLTLKVS
jgi:hypothetical protein